MSDNKRYNGESPDELESSLEDLLNLAFTKKKENESKNALDFKVTGKKPSLVTSSYTSYDGNEEDNWEPEKDNSFDTSKFDVDEVVARATVSRIKDTDGFNNSSDEATEDEPSESPRENEIQKDMSIEDMVANAMSAKNGVKIRNIERVATEDDAISQEELDEMLRKNDSMYKQYVDHKENPRKKKWYQNTLLMVMLAIIAFCLIVVGIVLVIFKDYYEKVDDKTIYAPQPGEQAQVTPDDTVDAFDYEAWLKEQLSGIADNTMSNENVTNVLIIAEDLRDTTGDSRGNTDVMMLASINKEKQTLTLTSFMRDIYCDIPGYYASRLNSAYAKEGPELLMKTLQQNFGVVVDRYVLVNFQSFIEVVEAIGGIEADVTQAQINAMRPPMAEQNNILGNPKGTDYLKEPGHYLLNGNQALAYARIRKGVGDDFGRTGRQREVIFTAINKAKQLPFGELKDLVDKILDSGWIKTNLEEGEIASLLLNAPAYMDYTQQQIQVPADGTWQNAKIRGMDVLSINFLKNAKNIQEIIYGESNISLGENSGEYVNTYTPPQTTPPAVETTPPQTTTTKPSATTTPTVVTTPPTDTGTAPPSITTPPVSSDSTSSSSDTSVSLESGNTDTGSSDSSSSAATTTPPPTDTKPPVTTTPPPTETQPPVVATDAPEEVPAA